MLTDVGLNVGLTVAVSAVTAAATASISVWTVSRRIRHQAVIEQRQKWRDALRDLVPRLLSERRRSSRERLRAAIRLRLNPSDNADAKALLDAIVDSPSTSIGRQIVTHFEHILKHDWERSKIEASFLSFNADYRASKRIARQRRRKNKPHR